jgi:hypothetical protein
MRLHVPETRETKALVVAFCSYEVAAVTTGLLPTITALTRRWPLLGVALVGALAVHFWAPTPPSHQ